ncbi:hypothetical protein J1614_008075 [Plenodomus biglobosus]|nr:hypothetical protein J1614_008075 [Plenodomus biglobosus]
MSWRRRDPSLSSIRTCAQRLLQSHETVLRTRCFSRTPSPPAQHDEDHGGNRPPGVSNLEWMQMQHYKRWQKRFTEDPYNAIFGASNNMLAGKGLKDWEWISTSFPKWMLREMKNVKEFVKVPTDEHNKKNAPEGVKNIAHDAETSQFSQSSIKATRFDRDNTTGVASPSDLRRPREQPHIKVVGKQFSVQDRILERPLAPNTPTVVASTKSAGADAAKSRSLLEDTELRNKEALAREASFIEEFLERDTDRQATLARDQSEDSVWRQTALQRRALRKLASQSDPEPVITTVRATGEISKLSSLGSLISGNAERKTLSTGSEAQDYHSQSSAAAETTTQVNEDIPQSTAQKLDQLPEHDIDFVSADEIRAAMRAKKRKFLSNEERAAERKKLEHAYRVAQEPRNVDVMIEAKTVNDQMIRRLERELGKPERRQPSTEEHGPSFTDSVNDPVVSNIENLKNWVEQSGAVFASHFWQDPTEEADVKKTRLFFDKITARIRKGRLAMRHVIQDLEADIPASKPLLKRMKQDEDLLDSAIQALRVRSGNNEDQGLSPKKLRAIQTLRWRFQDTDSELETAYVVLQESSTADIVAAVTSAFKRRLAIASRMTQKNAHLTRCLIWSLQARLEDPEIHKNVLTDYKAVANSLLTLRDTQIALARLLDRALSIYGVEAPKALNDFDSLAKHSGSEAREDLDPLYSPLAPMPSQVGKVQIRADAAAEECLANEVEAQKMAMRGLSDDGYAHAPKATQVKPIEERSALAHSLFRPFGPVLDSLTNDISAQALKADEEAKKATHDANLVTEVKAAYEDTYGPITVGHKQLAEAAEEVKESEKGVRQFDMLKNDPVLSSAHAITPHIPATPSESHRAANASSESSIEHIAEPAAVQANEVGNSSSATLTEAVSADPVVTPTSSDPPSDSRVNVASNLSPDLSKLPTYYTILLYDAQSDSVSVSTSTSPPPRDITPIIALPQALATLDAPAKFIPHIPEGLEIVSVKRDMLVLRDSLTTVDATATRPQRATNAPTNASEETDIFRRDVNPIDGTARLSPTGYVGPEESREQLAKEFEERRQAAEKVTGAEATFGSKHQLLKEHQKAPKEKRGGGASSVVKTAIWAAATCYVFGVIGEILSGP